MAQAIVEIDLSTYEAIKTALERVRELKAKWPDDYKSRLGYQSTVDHIMELLPYAFR
jgi:hypothetical protein